MSFALAAASGMYGPAIAAIIGVILVMISACGDGVGSEAGEVSPTATTAAGGEATPVQTSPEVFDLATESALLTASGGDAGDLVQGIQSLAHGDFNGDGFQDLLIGAPFGDGPDNGREEAGEAYVIFGGAELAPVVSLAEGEQTLTIYGASEGDALGFSVLGADVNGDAMDDIIIGAPGVTGGQDPRTDQGQVYVLFGSSGLAGSLDIASGLQSLTVTGSEGFSRLGHATASGDVNGDGVADLILGAPFAGREPNTPPGGPRTEVGEVYVVFGSTSLAGSISIVAGQQDLTIAGQKSFGQFGATVAGGDVNADSIDDVIVGAPQVDEPDESRQAGGAVYVFFGGDDVGDKLSVGDEDIVVMGSEEGDNLGFPLAAADINGDGVDDLISGARRASGPENRAASGTVNVVFGEGDLSGTINLAEPGEALSIFGSSHGQLLPTSLAASDLNGDGVADLLMGSVQAETSQDRPEAGLVYVVLGGQHVRDDRESVEQAAHFIAAGAKANDFLGSALDALPLVGGEEPQMVALAAGAGSDSEGALGQVYVIPFSPP